MTETDKPFDRIIYDLRERAKELNCLYQVQELLNRPEISIDEVCEGIVEVIPPGWQYPDVCQAEIMLGNKIFQSPGFIESNWILNSQIIVQDEFVGRISVSYKEERPNVDEGPFLKEERKLIDTIADQLGFYLLHEQLREVFQEQLKFEEEKKGEWWVILDLLTRTDPKLLMRISRKMINYLYWRGIREAENLLEHFNPPFIEDGQLFSEANRPFQIDGIDNITEISDEVFRVANQYLTEEEILENIQKWIKEDRSGFLVNILVNPSSSLEEISSAIERYHHLTTQGLELSEPREHWFRVAMIRRILSNQKNYINVAKDYIAVDDFNEFLQRVIFPSGSHGNIGGKSSGLYLAAQILRKHSEDTPLFENVKTPKTWYLTSDGIFYFMSYNNLEDIVEQKYKSVNQIRQEYPYVINIFKNSRFPPEIVRGLSLALDDFGDIPLIVRSSSLLEDRIETAFAGKYKSLFIANKGSKEERLIALMDAITEVYASMFGPDPIEYRYEHGLIDNHEEMGIMIQEVVGNIVGNYFFPAFAGVAFTNNEFRWSSRIKREDGLIRIVPGLGTRAVDRVSDDYPVLISPGNPNIRVNVTPDEVIRYSPKYMDVINLKTRSFVTINIFKFLKESGSNFPSLKYIISLIKDDRLVPINTFAPDLHETELVVTFEGLFTNTNFLAQIHEILDVLRKTLEFKVDIEFAHDGENFYLLQCRAQSYSDDIQPASIPDHISDDQILFTTSRHISNAVISDITDIVYVDPISYAQLSNRDDLLSVGRAVSRLNQLLPKRQFILMGPGRWGSRGDIRLGVNVTYSDINNTAMLIEIARKHGDYSPDPSFGTHFFQDLVEASIKYLPLYPDSKATLFNEIIFTNADNKIGELLPEFEHLSDVIRVIHVSDLKKDMKLQILMNADQKKAIAHFYNPDQ